MSLDVAMNTTFLLILTALIAFGGTSIFGLWIIPVLRRLKYGQTILDIGPSWHKAKQGTPTMGGIMFIFPIIGAVIATFLLLLSSGRITNTGLDAIINVRLFAGLAMACAFSLIGFGDDYVKVRKKQNEGFSARQKLVLQFAVAIVYLWTLYSVGDRATELVIPFFGEINIGLFYFPLCAVGIVFVVNAVNLTDGIDGLATSVTIASAFGFLIICFILGNEQMSLLAIAIIAGCIGFLIYNMYPARVFMGDTGSMFLGGCVVALAFGVRIPLFLALLGIIYIAEALSVVIQVSYYKATGKRIFKMSPIHHHFEMSSYTENQIVITFTLVQIISSMLAVLAIRMI